MVDCISRTDRMPITVVQRTSTRSRRHVAARLSSWSHGDARRYLRRVQGGGECQSRVIPSDFACCRRMAGRLSTDHRHRARCASTVRGRAGTSSVQTTYGCSMRMIVLTTVVVVASEGIRYVHAARNVSRVHSTGHTSRWLPRAARATWRRLHRMSRRSLVTWG